MILMSNLSAKIVRTIVADYFPVYPEQVRISGYVSELSTYKEWFGYGKKGFEKIVTFTENNFYFIVSVYDGVYTVHAK
jgi:hypothetical protein